LIGGSADLNSSTNTALKGLGDFQPSELGGPGTLGAVGGEWGYAGHNVAFGVREHAMDASRSITHWSFVTGADGRSPKLARAFGRA
jgi:transketolase